MVIYSHNFNDPYFNLACEEYILANKKDDDIFMLWINDPSVIIGRNQNAYAELNIDFINKNNIKVVRRLTGGGAVFHDNGNVNFTFITQRADDTVLNFELFTKPIIKALKSLGADAELSGRNDIVIDGYKISGNAQCGFYDRIMHHGTLLFNADLSRLAGSLRADDEKIKSKGIKSIRSRVANIKDFIDKDMSVIEFKSYIESGIEAERVEFTDYDIKSIQKLADEKYSKWEWNFGESKKYGYTNKKRFQFGTLEINVNVDGGYIKEIRFNGDYFGLDDVADLENRLIGKKFDSADIYTELRGIEKYIAGVTAEDLLDFILNIM